MKSAFKKYWATIIPFIAIVVIFIVWWVNGAEKEDAWLYIFSIAMVLTPAIDTFFKKKNEDQ